MLSAVVNQKDIAAAGTETDAIIGAGAENRRRQGRLQKRSLRSLHVVQHRTALAGNQKAVPQGRIGIGGVRFEGDRTVALFVFQPEITEKTRNPVYIKGFRKKQEDGKNKKSNDNTAEKTILEFEELGCDRIYVDEEFDIEK